MESDKILKTTLFLILISGIVLGGVGFWITIYNHDIAQPRENLEKYGLKVSNEEIECWKACGEKENYFYTTRGRFSSVECECGLEACQKEEKNGRLENI